MLRRNHLWLKKGWTDHPGGKHRGAKNLAWNPKMSEARLQQFFPLYMENPGRRPRVWHDLEFQRLGMVEWPKEVGFFNAGDNFELSPEMMYRLFRKNNEEGFWTAEHNERAVIHLLPIVEKNADRGTKMVEEIFQAHVKRFGPDHTIYNAVMQAAAFAKDLGRCKDLLEEMKRAHLDPNAQTYINLVLATRLAGQTKEAAFEWFSAGVRDGALSPIVRIDTEFQMWWDQLDRLGSFTSEKGFLSVNEEGAKPQPSDMWATWGWDKRYERKFVSRKEYIQSEIKRRTRSSTQLYGTVIGNVKRQPWARYRGLRLDDWKGPQLNHRRHPFHGSPKPSKNTSTAPLSY